MKEKVPGKVELWECYTGPTRLQPTRFSREDFNHTLIHVVVLSAVCNYYSH